MKIGIVGNGSMGRRRIFHSLTYGYSNIIGWDIREDRRKEVELKFGIKTTASQNQFLKNDFDILFICVPPAEHYFYLKTATEKGWNFMVENPVSHKTYGLTRIIKEVANKKLIANVSCNLRFLKPIQRIKEIIQENILGEVISGIVDIGEYLPDWHPYELYTDYYPSKREMGGGLDAICDLDWLVDIFGDIVKMNSVYSKKSNLLINTYDIIDFILEFKNGPQIVLHTDMLQTPYARATKFITANGVIMWDYLSQVVKYFNRSSNKWVEYYDKDDEIEFDNGITTIWAEKMYLDDSIHFFKCLKGNAIPLNTLESNLKILKQFLKSINYED